MKKVAIALIALLPCVFAEAATQPPPPLNFAIMRFVATNGSPVNDGVTPNAPWSLNYALGQASPTSILILMPGVYPSIEIGKSGTRIASRVKWGAKVQGSPGLHALWSDTNVSDVTIDGLEVAGSALDGIKLSGTNCVIRNCWIHNSTGNGVSSRFGSNTLIERNLVEHNGTGTNGGAGISLSGTNCIIRSNVSRYNSGWGCELYEIPPGSSAECSFYNNLVYSNKAGVTVWSPTGQTNYVSNNTIISLSDNCLIADFGYLAVTNNIMIVGGGNPVIWTTDGATVWTDYNLVNAITQPGGTHDILSSLTGFVNPSAGLYWLSLSSPAIGMAYPGGAPPVDFFGQKLAAVSDVGAFRYNNALEVDARVLDPSSASGADYWAQLSSPSNTPPIISSQPQAQTVTAGQSAVFAVSAIGATPLTYKWTFNGSAVGTNSNMYVRTNCQLGDSGEQAQVTVGDAAGSVQSIPATLTVTPSSGTNYYASPGGSSSNTGLSPDSAWPLQYALDNAGASNTVIVMDGAYTPIGQPFYIHSAPGQGLTVRAQNKWKAVIKDSSNYGIQIYSCQYATVDGLCISNSYYNGFKISCDHITIRNCWITSNGTSCSEGDGIAANGSFAGYTPGYNVFEYNLIERNGCPSVPLGHAIYFNGPNNTVRGNVCRYNGYFGIHLFGSYYSPGTPEHNDGNAIYNNLVYGHTNGYGLALWNAAQDNVNPTVPNNPGTNYAFCNTILDGIQVTWGGALISNNIVRAFVGAHYGLPIDPYTNVFAPAFLKEDYNLTDHNPITQSTFNPGGTHDVITPYNSSWFNNASTGLYWLSTSSPARNAAFPTLCGPVNFFGTAQQSVTDIGAFQYDSALANDVRVLDPPGITPDYWSGP